MTLLLLLLLTLCAMPGHAAIVAGPWLQAATETQMVVMWESSDNVAGSVSYGATTSYGTTVASTRVTVPAAIDTATGLPVIDTIPTPDVPDTPAILHTVRLTGLTTNTLYHYRVTSGATVSADYTLRTHKTSGTWRIVHASDASAWRIGSSVIARNSIINYAPDYIIMPGDFTIASANNQYRKFFKDDAGLFKTTVHYAARGNHDNRPWSVFNHWFYNGQTGGTSWGNCAPSDCENYYSFDIGPVHFVSINNDFREQDYPAGAVDWLKADLAASSATWKVVFMKHNPNMTSYAAVQARFLMPIFTTGGVDLAMCGGNSPGYHLKVNNVWYQHGGMENGHGYFGIEVSTAALNITYYTKEGVAQYTYNIGGGTPPLNSPPVAAFTAIPTAGNIPLTVNFNGATSTDSDGSITSYSWNFGEGALATGPTTSHTYTTAGTYNVVLTVRDDDNASDTATTTITATDPVPANAAPVAAIGASPTSGTFPLTVAFTSTGSSDSDGTITGYSWAFGDGTLGTGSSPSHTYTAAGTYPAVLTVTDNDGATDTAQVTITVTASTPTGSTIEILAAADTYVYSAQPTANFGSAANLIVRDTSGTTADRLTYVRFDLAPIPASVVVTSAVLHLAPSTGSQVLPVKVHATTDAWQELTVTWDTRPATGTFLGTLPITGVNTYFTVDLTSYVQTLYTGSADLNVAVLDDTSANILVQFSSRTASTRRPKLVVTYAPVTDPIPPDGSFPSCTSVDKYRGCTSVHTAHPELNGYFRTEKLADRWWFMTPEGHGFFSLSVSVLNGNSRDGQDQLGNYYETYASTKYGGFPINRPNWANATLDKLRQLGFNTIGTFSHNIQGLDPGDKITNRLPWISTLRVTNSVVLDDLVGNIWEGPGMGGGTFPDLYHPGFVGFVAAETATVLTPEMIADPYIVYHFVDQADELRGIAYNHNSLCWGAWVGKPTLAVKVGGVDTAAPNYLKQKLAADMQTKYTTIAALNAAWGTAYTAFASAGGYGTGTGFVDQDPARTTVGPTYANLDTEATPAMVADCNAFVEEILGYYATVATNAVRAVDTNHLIASPNDSSLDEAAKAFSGKFDLLYCEFIHCYDLLATKMPLISMDFDFLTVEKDSPLSFDGPVGTTTELLGTELKLWDTEQPHCWMALGSTPLGGVGFQNRNRVAFFDEAGAIKNLGFLNNGNEYNIVANGIDELGCWFRITSRASGSGTISQLQAALTAEPLVYRRNGFGNFGPPQTFTGVGYDTQEAKALAWRSGVQSGLSERAANGDFPRVAANWWKWSDNGWTYSLERNNWGLVTHKDNAYNGQEATTVGADGVPGTLDDEEADYGDLWTVVTETNTTVYGVAGTVPAEPVARKRRAFVW